MCGTPGRRRRLLERKCQTFFLMLVQLRAGGHISRTREVCVGDSQLKATMLFHFGER